MTTLEKTVEMISSLPEHELIQVLDHAASLRDAPAIPPSWDEIDPDVHPDH